MMVGRFENSGFGPVSESGIANELSPNGFAFQNQEKLLQKKKT